MIARRNIGILAHIDAGKTTVSEHLLHVGGTVRRPGSVDAGTTVTDWMLEEQQRGITIASAASTFQWGDVEVTLVDTPGHVDFTIEVERSLRVLDGVVLVVSGPDRVQAQTETVWHQAARHGLPAIGFVNKLDREGFVLDEVLASIKERLGVTPVLLQIPHVDDERIVLVDVRDGSALAFDREGQPIDDASVPDEIEVLRLEALDAFVDAVSACDDAYAEAVLEGRTPTADMHARALAAMVAARAGLPLLFGAASLGVGIERLADAIVELVPRGRRLPAFDAAGESMTIADSAGVTSAYVFKTEPRRGGRGQPFGSSGDVRLAFVRVVTGRIVAGTALVRTPSGAPLGPARPVAVAGADYAPIGALEEGAIGALWFDAAGPATAMTGDTIGDAILPFTFERLRPPEPVLERTVEAPDPAAHDRMISELQRLCEDDPSLRLGTDRETGRAVLSGMGELHLEIALERASRATGLALRSGRPQIRQRRMLLGAGQGEATVSHPTGRARVRVVVDVAPGGELVFQAPPLDRPEQRDAVLSGLESAAGLDGQGQRLLGGRLGATVEAHGADVVPIMFRDAAEWAALRAIEAAGATLAEPWCTMSVVVPDAAVGRVVGDLSRRRGRVRKTESRGPIQELHVDAPLAELVGYASDLRSLTAGRGRFSIEPTGFRAATTRESD